MGKLIENEPEHVIAVEHAAGRGAGAVLAVSQGSVAHVAL